MATRNCPYCEHLNDAAAKFCVSCGAVMHLAPCPHCGAVNHINVSSCYRCGGDLPPVVIGEGEAPAVAPADAEAPADDEIPGPPAPAVAPSSAAPATPDSSGHPSLAVMFIILVAFGATAFFAYKQKSNAGNAESAAAKPVAPVSLPASPSPSPAANSVPATLPAAPVPQKEAQAAPVGADTAKGTAADVPNKVVPAGAKPRPPASPRPAEAAKPVTPCTEAVAALGLCKLDAK